MAATGASVDTPTAGDVSSDELRGRSAGIVVGAVMGMVWVGVAVGALRSVIVAATVLLVTFAVVAVLVTGARRVRRAAAAMPAAAPSGPDLSRVRRRFTLVVVGEAIAIAIATNVLSRAGRSEWIPTFVCAAAGLHFIPLARLFGLRLYYGTAIALCLVATTTMILGGAGAAAPIWNLVPGFGAALALWATSGRLLSSTVPSPRVGALDLPGLDHEVGDSTP